MAFVIPSKVADQMEEVVGDALFTYLHTFVQQDIFPDWQAPQAQDIILRGIARAMRKYQEVAPVPVTRTLALNLLDITTDPKQ